MKQVMEILGLDIPKWEGPTVCQSSTGASGDDDIKPPKEEKQRLVKPERKREATEEGPVKEEETVSVKRERADSPLEVKEKQ